MTPSVSMLQPGQPALKRETALEVLAELGIAYTIVRVV